MTEKWYGANVHIGILDNYVKKKEFVNLICPACNKKNVSVWSNVFVAELICENTKCKGYLKPFTAVSKSFNGHLMVGGSQ